MFAHPRALVREDGRVKADAPSMTAAGVALARASFDRPSAPTGDPDAELRLARTLAAEWTREPRERRRGSEFARFLVVRTRFFDDAVVRALDEDVRQIVILGAGYDARPLRFRTPGVRFFEVDHPATQRDKRARLAEIGASLDGITFVAADFTEPGLDAALDAAGYDRTGRALFTCEGVLRYLPEASFRALLRTAADVAAPASELAASISTRELDAEVPEHEAARQRALAETGEPVLTVPPRAVALQWLVEAGWSDPQLEPVDEAALATRPGRLLVRAVRR
jgi:methyltransferase (TIGR00027 family)